MAVSVGAANADIASSQYVDDKIGTVETSVTNLGGRVDAAEEEIDTLGTELETGLAGKQDTRLVTSADYSQNISSETGYPSVAAVATAISAATSGINTAVGGKVDVAQGADSANQAVITGATGDITTGQIATGMISDGAVTSAKIGTDAVGSAQIAAGAVTSDELAADAVTADKIADGVITTTEISATAGITATQLSTGVQTSLGKANTAVQTADLAGYAKTDALAKKQDKLTETQQAAVDSGITKEKVTAYDAYATSKADATALTTLEDKVTTNTTNIGTNTTAIGTLTTLTTTEQGNLVGAINEVAGEVADVSGDIALKQNITDNTFTTTAKTVPGAVNELKTAVDAAADAAEAAQTAADAKIPMPSGECSNPTNKCVLVSNGTNSFEWEVIARGAKTGGSSHVGGDDMP